MSKPKNRDEVLLEACASIIAAANPINIVMRAISKTYALELQRYRMDAEAKAAIANARLRAEVEQQIFEASTASDKGIKPHPP